VWHCPVSRYVFSAPPGYCWSALGPAFMPGGSGLPAPIVQLALARFSMHGFTGSRHRLGLHGSSRPSRTPVNRGRALTEQASETRRERRALRVLCGTLCTYVSSASV